MSSNGPAVRLTSALATAAVAALASTVVVHAVKALPNARRIVRPALADRAIVCMGRDAVLRGRRGQGCSSSETALNVKTVKLNTTMSPPSSTLADLKRRVDRLTDLPAFEVVDHKHVVFSVSPSRVQLNGPNGQLALEVIASAFGSVVRTHSSDGLSQVNIGVTESHTGIAMFKDAAVRLDLGRRPSGGYALRFLSDSKDFLAGFGESVAGSGALTVADSDGRVLAAVTARKSGSFNVNSEAGAAIVSFRQSQSRAGFLSIGTADGREAVKMVVNLNRYGSVIAGPLVGPPLLTGSGFPGSYILGCSAGPACIPR